ncbi:MAG: hypothetical protein M1826_001367 [Phylliscum demangeonii]|nr:MAG: hypothetical protein M1826_001367 [Phylliscum demangeonii]
MSAAERVSTRSKSPPSPCPTRSRPRSAAPSEAWVRAFEPCAATASMFLSDAGQTAIVWDLFDGQERARFTSNEDLGAGTWLRHGNVVVGNAIGHIILFEPSTSEHRSARTFGDPVTALAPTANGRTYAIGYRIGCILIAALQPTFTILHTRATSRASSPQRSERLATQTEDGEVRIWSMVKPWHASQEAPREIRILKRTEHRQPGPNGLAWCNEWPRRGAPRRRNLSAWDVRTQNLTCDLVPTPDVVSGLAVHEITATLFTLGRDHTVQQYDLHPPTVVAQTQHLPPFPPPAVRNDVSITAGTISPLDWIAEAMHASSHSRHRSGSEASTSSPLLASEGTQFSHGSAASTKGSSLSVASLVRHGKRPAEPGQGRLSDVPYRNPCVTVPAHATAAHLRRQMLSVVFGWDDDIESLLTSGVPGHAVGSAATVLLSKWMNNVDADMMASMMGSDATNSSDWMLLALSALGGQASTRKTAQAFVQRLLQKGDVHGAATVLLGLGEPNDAVEVEAVLLTCLVFSSDRHRQSQLCRRWGEYAVKRGQQHLAIRWYVGCGGDRSRALTSARSFSCTGVETSSVVTSPRAYDTTTLVARGRSPPLASARGRGAAQMPSLKLITSFDDAASTSRSFGDRDRTPMHGAGVTPIVDSAISPGGTGILRRRPARQPESARTATPTGFGRRRLPSMGETAIEATPRPVVATKGPRTPVDGASEREGDGERRRDKRPAAAAAAAAAEISRPRSTEAPLTLSAATYHPDEMSSGGSASASASASANASASGSGSASAEPRTTISTAPESAGSGQPSQVTAGMRGRRPKDLPSPWRPSEYIITGDYMAPGGGDAFTAPATRRLRPPRTESMPSALETSSSPTSGRSGAPSGKSMDRYISSLEEANYHVKRQREANQLRQESRDRRRAPATAGPASVAERPDESGKKARRGRSHDRSQNRGRRFISPPRPSHPTRHASRQPNKRSAKYAPPKNSKAPTVRRRL